METTAPSCDVLEVGRLHRDLGKSIAHPPAADDAAADADGGRGDVAVVPRLSGRHRRGLGRRRVRAVRVAQACGGFRTTTRGGRARIVLNVFVCRLTVSLILRCVYGVTSSTVCVCGVTYHPVVLYLRVRVCVRVCARVRVCVRYCVVCVRCTGTGRPKKIANRRLEDG